MSLKRVLIITYYWPPCGGAGVHRWLKFSKYLPGFGWQPVIYTPENADYPIIDKSLNSEVGANIEELKRAIWEPYRWYNKFLGRKTGEKLNTGFLSENKKSSTKEKIAVWVRSNFFIPDAKKFWIKPSVRFLTRYLEVKPVDIIVSTGPPHSMHLIALGLKKKFNIPWIADFRDPWTNIDFYHELILSKWADRKQRRLENESIRNCDCLITIGKFMKNEFAALGAKKVETITNGYDPENQSEIEHVLDKKFSITHVGTIARSRNPEIFWKVISDLLKTDSKFREYLIIKLVGKVDFSVQESIHKYGLDNHVRIISYLPHKQALQIEKTSSVLLLSINQTENAKGILTGKIFEYLNANRPILAIGPVNGDAAEILKETGTGVISGYIDENSLKENIYHYFKLFCKNELIANPKGIDKYSNKNLTQKLTEVFEAFIT